MTVMGSHARQGWTGLQASLAAVCAVIGVAIAVLGFIDIYLTVTHLLRASWGAWSWTVIVLGEGSFTGCYVGWLLLDLRDRPPKRIRWFLFAYLSAFAAGSVALNVDAAGRSFAAVASHLIVVVSFFGYLLFAKVLVRRLSADPSARALETAMADARQHAIDLCRDRKGLLWRYRVPSLLRRQVTSGRLPDEVRSDVAMKVSVGRTSGWEGTVRDWVFRELNIDVIAEAANAKAVRDIARSASESVTEAVAEAPPAAAPEPLPETPRKPVRTTAPDYSRKPSRAAVKKLSGADLAPYVREILGADPAPAKQQVMDAFHVGAVKAGEALDALRGNGGREAPVVTPFRGHAQRIGASR
jgi:hypothetical protein